jgi:hypothetical protein
MAGRSVANRSEAVTLPTLRRPVEVVRQQWRSQRPGSTWNWDGSRGGSTSTIGGTARRLANRCATLCFSRHVLPTDSASVLIGRLRSGCRAACCVTSVRRYARTRRKSDRCRANDDDAVSRGLAPHPRPQREPEAPLGDHDVRPAGKLRAQRTVSPRADDRYMACDVSRNLGQKLVSHLTSDVVPVRLDIPPRHQP